MKEYSNEEITVCWIPEKCIHSRNCIQGLPEVFDRSIRPWINIKGASTDEIMKTIDKCPSGALSYKKAEGAQNESEPEVKIKVTSKGPLLVEGRFKLIGEDGKIAEVKGPAALCRCGGSGNKPYCDGTHRVIGFEEKK